MKSRPGSGKTASSMLLLTAIGLFATNPFPAQASEAESVTSTNSSSLTSDESSSLASSLFVNAPGSSSTTELGASLSEQVTEPSANPVSNLVAPGGTPNESAANNEGAANLVADSTVITQQDSQVSSEDSLNAQPSRLNESVLPATTSLELGSPLELNESMAQVTSVTQLSDVQPTDWAFTALQSLVERYGCIVGYPDGTFRGDRATTRYEFAAGLNACLDRITELIDAATGEGVSQEDLDAIARLQEEFSAELATLRGRVDSLEGRTAELEANQFSTTTRLFGQAIVGIQGRTDNQIRLFLDELEDPDTNINVITNVQLSLLTQFDERTILLTGLQAGTGTTANVRLTNDTRLAYEGDTNSGLRLSDLTLRRLFGNNLAVVVGTNGVNAPNVFRGANPDESAGQGPLSAFAQRNPIINIGAGQGGLGFDWQIASRLSLQGVYSSSNPQDPEIGGIFGNSGNLTTVGVQLTLVPTDNIDVALNYINAYSPDGTLATGVGDDTLTLAGEALKTDAFGATIAWRVTPQFTVGGWGGYTTSDIPGESGNVETVNWMAFLNFPDLFGEGNLGGIYVGQPPKITSSDLPSGTNVPDFVNRGGFGDPGGQPSSTTHVEAFYRLRVSDNISITPGVIVIFNPRHNADNDTITIGALRTTFTF